MARLLHCAYVVRHQMLALFIEAKYFPTEGEHCEQNMYRTYILYQVTPQKRPAILNDSGDSCKEGIYWLHSKQLFQRLHSLLLKGFINLSLELAPAGSTDASCKREYLFI